MKYGLGAGAILSALLWALPSAACYTGLVLIPTTDVTPAYTWAIDLQGQGYSGAFRTDALIVNTEIGIKDRAELGVDFDVTSDAHSNRRALLNAKVVLYRNAARGLAAAVGLTNYQTRFAPTAFVVGSKELGLLRFHAGIQYDRDAHLWNAFMGLDRSFESGWSLMADYTGGEANFASVGIGWQPTERLGLLAGVQWPNGGGPGVYVIHVVLNGPLKR